MKAIGCLSAMQAAVEILMNERTHSPRKPATPAASRPASRAAGSGNAAAATSSHAGLGHHISRIPILNASASGRSPQSSGMDGSVLPAPVQAKMERSFGHSFADVRIHSGPEAAQAGALAFARGTDLFFQSGLYDPWSPAGQALLGHELTHVVQQRAGRAGAAHGEGSINADSALEAEADRLGAMAAMGMRADVSGALAGLSGGIGALPMQRKTVCDEDGVCMEMDDSQAPAPDDPRALTSEPVSREGRDDVDLTGVPPDPLPPGASELPPGEYYHPPDVSQREMDRLMGKYVNIDGDQGEGCIPHPYVAPEGQCTVGYGHVVPKSQCDDPSETKYDISCQGTPAKGDKPAVPSQAERLLRGDVQKVIHDPKFGVDALHVNLDQTQMDAMTDLALHVGSIPKAMRDDVNTNMAFDPDKVRQDYLQTATTMKDPNTGEMVRMQNFVDRRQYRWPEEVKKEYGPTPEQMPEDTPGGYSIPPPLLQPACGYPGDPALLPPECRQPD